MPRESLDTPTIPLAWARVKWYFATMPAHRTSRRSARARPERADAVAVARVEDRITDGRLAIRARLNPMRHATPATPRARALERVREITVQVLGDRDVRVYLFGSSVTGRIRRSSDIDVAIDPLRALPSALLAELRERLDESEVPVMSTSLI
jgi:predicted nucleotidyltransferase